MLIKECTEFQEVGEIKGNVETNAMHSSFNDRTRENKNKMKKCFDRSFSLLFYRNFRKSNFPNVLEVVNAYSENYVAYCWTYFFFMVVKSGTNKCLLLPTHEHVYEKVYMCNRVQHNRISEKETISWTQLYMNKIFWRLFFSFSYVFFIY